MLIIIFISLNLDSFGVSSFLNLVFWDKNPQFLIFGGQFFSKSRLWFLISVSYKKNYCISITNMYFSHFLPSNRMDVCSLKNMYFSKYLFGHIYYNNYCQMRGYKICVNYCGEYPCESIAS